MHHHPHHHLGFIFLFFFLDKNQLITDFQYSIGQYEKGLNLPSRFFGWYTKEQTNKNEGEEEEKEGGSYLASGNKAITRYTAPGRRGPWEEEEEEEEGGRDVFSLYLSLVPPSSSSSKRNAAALAGERNFRLDNDAE